LSSNTSTVDSKKIKGERESQVIRGVQGEEVEADLGFKCPTVAQQMVDTVPSSITESFRLLGGAIGCNISSGLADLSMPGGDFLGGEGSFEVEIGVTKTEGGGTVHTDMGNEDIEKSSDGVFKAFSLKMTRRGSKVALLKSALGPMVKFDDVSDRSSSSATCPNFLLRSNTVHFLGLKYIDKGAMSPTLLS